MHVTQRHASSRKGGEEGYKSLSPADIKGYVHVEQGLRSSSKAHRSMPTHVHSPTKVQGTASPERTNVRSVSLEGFKWLKCNCLQKCEIFELYFFGTKLKFRKYRLIVIQSFTADSLAYDE